MWYRQARIVKAQGLNVVGPAVPTPLMPLIPNPDFTQPPVPINDVAPANVQEFPSDIPAGVNMPPATPQTTLPEPPVHENCHCRIKTMPGGRKIWEFSNNACPECRQAGELFNAQQATLFGI